MAAPCLLCASRACGEGELVASAQPEDRRFGSSQYATGACPVAAPPLELGGRQPEQTAHKEVKFEPRSNECTYWVTWERRGGDEPERPYGTDSTATT